MAMYLFVEEGPITPSNLESPSRPVNIKIIVCVLSACGLGAPGGSNDLTCPCPPRDSSFERMSLHRSEQNDDVPKEETRENAVLRQPPC